MTYDEQAAQHLTTQRAKSASSVGGSADKQASTAQSISIVIPVYNEEHHLKACLDSIAEQTIMPDEVIVVDNNSTDKTVQIAGSYPFVKLLSEKKQGIVYGRDKGFDIVTSDIIGRIDGDTILPPDWVSKVKDFYADEEHRNQALTGGGYFYNIRLPRFNGWIQSQLAYRTNRFVTGFYIVWGSNMALPRNIWWDVRQYVCHRLDIHEDLDLAIHLHERGHSITYQENLRVGVYLKRLWENRAEQREHMSRWPNTLKVHDFRDWWLGSIGNVLLRYIMQPIVFVMEGFGRLMGRRLK